MSKDRPDSKKAPGAHTIKAPVAITAPLFRLLEREPLLNLHALALECLRFGVEELVRDPPRLLALVRAEKARQRARYARPGA